MQLMQESSSQTLWETMSPWRLGRQEKKDVAIQDQLELCLSLWQRWELLVESPREWVHGQTKKGKSMYWLIFFTGLPLPHILVSFCPASTLCWLLWSSSPLEPVDTSGLCRSWDRGEAARAAHTSLSLRLGLENTRQLHTWPPVTIGNKQTAN